MKITDAQIIEAYQRLKSFGSVADELGLSRSGVHLRLKKMGYKPAFRDPLSEAEKILVNELYAAGFDTNDGQLDALAINIGKRKNLITLYASRAGLCVRDRKGRKWISPPKPPKEKKPYVHPRGMLGKKHAEQFKEKMRKYWLENPRSQDQWSASTLKAMQTKVARYGSVGTKSESRKLTWKSAWREIGGVRKYFRSRWEANYARVLQWRLEQGIISAWQHEPETFWFLEIKRGVRSYLPDFKVTFPDGSIEYHEVKGWMDDRSKTTLARMAKYYPQLKVVVVGADWFKANKNFRIVLKDWESATS